MSFLTKDIDPAFQGAGAKAGLEVWCVENLQLVPVPTPLHGKFYSGSVYIILSTTLLKSTPQHDIHYWLGNEANEVESALASDKALELDAVLGSCTVQYQEVQGQETQKFLSYFKPCIIPIEGKYSSQSATNGEAYQVSLLTCKGDHAVRVKVVNFSRSSLNHNDVFILDTASKIFLFNGCNSSIQERAKALEVVKYIKDNKHSGKCEVAIIEDGKFVGDSDVGEFWSLFGGYAPIPRDSPSAFQQHHDTSSVKLFWINTQGKLCPVGTNSLNKEMLEKSKCYMLDCDAEVFVWVGRNTSVTERKTSISASEDFLRNQGRSNGTHLTFLTEGLESAAFRFFFDDWPHTVETRLYDEGREKVAAMFKQQGYDVKELPEEACQLSISSRGTLKVWHVNGEELFLTPVAKQRNLYSGDCYVMQYTYPENGRDENLFYSWFGHGSAMEERVSAISHMSALVDSTRGDPVMAQVIQGKEPVQFFLIFQTLIVFKGGMSSSYKRLIAERGIEDETYDETKTALFRVQGTNPNNMQAIQVDIVSSSLNSSYCYILQSGTSIFTWIGNLSSTTDHDLLDRMLEIINPDWQSISLREGSEPDIFWNALGGKGEYPREKEMKKFIEDPHLFTCSCLTSDFKVKEIYNFTQDDLTTEDVLVLDCHNEIYVWIGRNSSVKSKQQALNLGLKFLEIDILAEGLSLDAPVYVVTEGYEPPFFTCFFTWDQSKANMHGNSFERKLATIKGKTRSAETAVRTSWKAYSRENTPDSSRSRSVSSNGFQRNASAASTISGSKSKSSGSPAAEPSPSSEHPNSSQADSLEAGLNALTFSCQELKVDSCTSVKDIDVTKREAYLSDAEFEEIFGMTKRAFYALPKWKQNKLKLSLNLF